jgi:CHASE2 domain-containing sensor protein
MVDGCLEPAQLAELAAGTLSPAERVRAEQHLAACSRCRRRSAARQEEERLFRALRDARALDPSVGGSGAETTIVEPRRSAPAAVGSDTIDGYTILSELHRGGQGVVYQAVQQTTQRTVALKLLLQGPQASARQRQRFAREVNLVAGLRHPNIVTLYDSGVTRDGRHYFAMEYIRGRSLEAYLAEAHLSIGGKLDLFRRICAAVGHAHQRGIVHRDLKPGNVIVDAAGEPHILDFGLAKGAVTELSGGAPVTLTGEFMGTLAYAAPEQTKGDPHLMDTRTDVYALGVMLYEACTGRSPYSATGPLGDVLRNIAEAEPVRPSTLGTGVDGEVETIILTAMAKDPRRRYPNAGAMGEDLALYLDGQPIRAKRDSTAYVVAKRARRAAARHVLAAYVGVFALAWLAGYLALGVRFPFRPFDRAFESAAVAQRHRFADGAWPPELVIVAMNDETHGRIGALAAEAQVADVSVDVPKSLRVLHGELMRRLARARPKVVAWDVLFATPEPQFDGRLAEGMAALQSVGTRVILGYFLTDETNRPCLSPPLLRQADGVGRVNLAVTADVTRGAMLATDRAPYPIEPSLALAVYAAWQHPGYAPHVVWGEASQVLDVRYARPAVGDSASLEWLGDVDRLRVFFDAEISPAPGSAGRQREAYWWTVVPEADVLAAHTVPYHEAFAADEAALRQWFGDKIVLVADNRADTARDVPDRGVMASGTGARTEFHCYMHAAALRDLMSRVSFAGSSSRQEVLALTAAAGLGLAAGILQPRGRRRIYRWSVGPILAGLVLGACFLVAVVSGAVLRPSSLLLTAVAGAIGAAWVTTASPAPRGAAGRPVVVVPSDAEPAS